MTRLLIECFQCAVISIFRSIDGIFTVFSNLKNQKAAEVQSVKSALYNVGVLVCLAALAGVFLVLLPFLNPLFWAFLFGAVLFPAKKKLAKAINLFIEELETTDTPIALGVVVFPFNGMMKVGEFITMFLITHIKVIAFGLCAMLSLRISVHYVPSELIGTVLNIAMWFHNFCAAFIGALNLKIILMLVAVHATAVLALWTPALAKIFTFCGQVLWILVAAFLCSFLGSLQIPAFILAMVYGAVGFSYDNELFGSFKKVLVKEPPIPNVPADETQLIHATPMGRLLKTRTHLSEIKQKMQLSFQQEARSHPAAAKKEVELESDTYFKILFYACTATVLWHQLWILFMCFIPISCFGGKELFKALGLWNFIEDQWRNNYELKLHSWVEPRRNALFPVCWSGVVTLNSKLHKFSCEKLKSFVDDISSIVMILLLIFGATFLGVFFFFQIYSETIAVAQLGSNLINRTLTHRPELVEMLPINMQSMNDVIDNAYKYSRGTIESYLDSLFNQTNPEVASKLKQQILSVWDRLVQSYMDRNNEGVGPRVGVESVLTTLDEIVATSGGETFASSIKLPLTNIISVTYTGLFAWGKSNLGMLMELSDSLWIVLKANLSLLFSTFTTLFSVLVGSGHAMIKFLFNTVSINNAITWGKGRGVGAALTIKPQCGD